MPQLVCANKRWGISADDFACPGLFSAFARFVSIALLIPLTARAAMEDCRVGVRLYLYFTLGIHAVAFINGVILVRQSSRGHLVQIEKRAGVGVTAAIELVLTTLHIGCAIFGLYAVFGASASECPDILENRNYERSLEAFALLNLIVGVFFVCSFCTVCAFRGNATWVAAAEDWHAEWNNSIFGNSSNQPPGPAGGFEAHREHTWSGRCGRLSRIFCCRSALTGDSQETFEILGKVMSTVLRSVEALHLTVSDIVTGLTLVRAVQKKEEIENNSQLLALQYGRVHPGASDPCPSTPETDLAHFVAPLYLAANQGQFVKTSVSSSIPSLLHGQGSRIKTFHFQMTPSSIPIDMCNQVKSSPGKKEIVDIWHFGKFSLAPYGWMLYMFSNLGTGLCKLCATCTYHRMCETRLEPSSVNSEVPPVSDRCCEYHPNSSGDCCGCNTTATRLQVEQLFRSDLIYVSWKSEWYKPALSVFYDRVKESLVIALRGTLSLDDCITDAVAIPVCANESEGLQRYAHFCATYKHRSGYAPEDADILESLNPKEAARMRVEGAKGRFEEQDSYYMDNRCNVDDWYIHAGILRSSERIAKELCDAGVFVENPDTSSHEKYLLGPAIRDDMKAKICRNMFDAGESKEPEETQFDHRKARIVIVGHSLGAGVSTGLAPLLAPSFPSLKTFAFSAPGATVSPSFSLALRPFVTTIILGKDLIPRAGFPNLRRLFYRMLLAYSSAKLSKPKLLSYGCQSCFSAICCNRRFGAENGIHVRVLEAIQHDLPIALGVDAPDDSVPDSFDETTVEPLKVGESDLSMGRSTGTEPLNGFQNFESLLKIVLRAEKHRLKISHERQLQQQNNRRKGSSRLRSAVSDRGDRAREAKSSARKESYRHNKHASFESTATIAEELWQPDDADRIMWVGGRIIHFTKLRTWSRNPLDPRCCSGRFTEYVGSWAHPADFGEILVSNLMIKDHMPDALVNVLNSVMESAEMVRDVTTSRGEPGSAVPEGFV